MDSELQPTCAVCGEVLGVYEPIVVIERGLPRDTSRAAEKSPPQGVAVHRDCHRRSTP